MVIFNSYVSLPEGKCKAVLDLMKNDEQYGKHPMYPSPIIYSK